MSELVLIVDDEHDLVNTLAYNLERAGLRTRSALTAQMGLDYARLEPVPDLILLDLMLPDFPGTEVCKQLKADERTKDVPVIVLSARTDEIDRVVAFEIGADDYVMKPFSVRELLLRVRNILKHRPAPEGSDSDLQSGRLRISGAAHRVWFDGEEVELTPLEFKILFSLASGEGRVWTRDKLLQDVWGGLAVTSRTIDTHVRRLREKLGDGGNYIQTVRGVGYRFVAAEGVVSR
ncbi:MAG: response regulator transcription factor [Deltaproteobacteria bacterium]|nr:MAG: response regulator transcription factor [Deltaproteobacteria bacterium]